MDEGRVLKHIELYEGNHILLRCIEHISSDNYTHALDGGIIVLCRHGTSQEDGTRRVPPLHIQWLQLHVNIQILQPRNGSHLTVHMHMSS